MIPMVPPRARAHRIQLRVVTEVARASSFEYLVRHASQIRAFALPIRYLAASSDFLQKEQFVE